MTTFRTGSPPQPPEDWLARLMDYHQIQSLLDGHAVCVDETTPLVKRLFGFFTKPEVAQLWHEYEQFAVLEMK